MIFRTEKSESPQRGQPKYRQLAQRLGEQIERGELQPGQRMTSFGQMRAQFGLTNSTIEKAYDLLERDGLIVREPNRGTFVAARAAEKNFRPARHAIVGLTGFAFGLSGQSSYWSAVLHGAREAADRAGQQILLLSDDAPIGWEKADGIVLCDWSKKEIPCFAPSQMPCVSLLVPSEVVASVAIDDYSGAQQATRHLIELGHERIAYLSGVDPSSSVQRVAGFRDAMRKAGLETPLRRARAISGNNDYGAHFIEAGRRVMQQWLAEDWNALNCTGLICHNDEIAVGAMDLLREAGVVVPDQVSVVGFDGLEIGNCISPRLTTVEIPLREAGAGAVEMLLRQIEADQVIVEHQTLPTLLRVRQSSGPAPRFR